MFCNLENPIGERSGSRRAVKAVVLLCQSTTTATLWTQYSPTLHDVLAGRLAGVEAICEANLPLSECGWQRGEREAGWSPWLWRALQRGGGREGGGGGETGGET